MMETILPPASSMSIPASHGDHAAASAGFKPADASAPLRAIDPSQKWIAVSQLQKAIRRGEAASATAWARALWDADPSYGLFRLAVIAAEEVAGADPALARAFLQTEIKKAWFDDRGGFAPLAYFVEAFALSPKDRTSCDLASVASIAHLAGVAPARGAIDYGALRSLAASPAASTPARLSALWLLAGTQKVPNGALGPDRPGRLVDFLGSCMDICPEPDLLVCIDLSLRLNKEPNPIGLALCRAAQRLDPPSLRHALDVPTLKIGHGLACAMDAHTREGRLAIGELLADSAQARSICCRLASKNDKQRLLGSTFFHLEGHDVTPRLEYGLARRAQAWHRKRLARIAGMDEPELFSQARELLPDLDSLRRKHAPWAFAVPGRAPTM